ncbi:F178B protein, partial [Asarcornis scutulata]|nr:F178B protein [Asarcornis scutulata]
RREEAAVAAPPGELRWYQIPLSSARVPRSGLFSYGFQASLRSYQELRARRRLRIGRPVAPPPPGLLAPWPPPPPPPAPAPGGAGGTARQPRGPARPHGRQRDAAPRREEPRRPRHSPVPEVPTGIPGAAGSRGQHGTARTAPRGAEEAAGNATTGWESPGDSEDDLIPLRDLLLLGSAPPSPAEPRRRLSPYPVVLSPRRGPGDVLPGPGPLRARPQRPAPLANSLEALLREKRLLLALFGVEPRLIPTVHPGEPIFSAQPPPAAPPKLDARGLQPHNILEGLFLCASPTGQAAFVRSGLLSLLYRSGTACPPPVLRWLFQVSLRGQEGGPFPAWAPPPCSPLSSLWQLMCLRPDTANAFQAMLDIWLSTGGEPWCPTLQDIGQAFAHLGADLGALRRRRLLPPELCPVIERLPDPSCCPGRASLDAAGTPALVTQLGDICKFLELCVAAQPRRYPDRARRLLLALLCFLGLDRALRRQPLPDLQQLLLCLLEGIADWRGQ